MNGKKYTLFRNTKTIGTNEFRKDCIAPIHQTCVYFAPCQTTSDSCLFYSCADDLSVRRENFHAESMLCDTHTNRDRTVRVCLFT